MFQAHMNKHDLCRALDYVRPEQTHIAIDAGSVESIRPIQRKPREISAPLRVCFLSRIAPKKNLDFALKVLSEVKTSIVFTIYGPKEDPSYWDQCKVLFATLPSNIKVCYEGEVHPDDVIKKLSGHDLFFFPTRGENYGHVIQEALSAGLPVLISDQTPWKNLDKKGIGWEYPLCSLTPFIQKIIEIDRWTNEFRTAVCERAAQYAGDRSFDPIALSQNRELFRCAIK